MGLPPLSSAISCSVFCILTIISVFCFVSTTYAISGNETDRLSLLEFKAKNDPFMALSSWNDTINFCQWRGVTCGRRHQRVTKLSLRSQKLVGSISPFIGNLSFLRFLYLGNNSFSHKIPQEIGRLHRLQVLELFNNSFGGRIPSIISNCSNLKVLDLASNQLAGEIPDELGSLSKLQLFGVAKNKQTGRIPPSLGNLSSLEELYLTSNNIGGSIPSALGQLMNLTTIAVGANQLSGTIPPSIFNLSSIITLDVGQNQIQGNLPWDLGITLPNLQVFLVSANQFTGSIPPSISNASNLEYLHILSNNFTGNVPSLEKLHRLQWLSSSTNQLGSGGADDLSFLCSLTNATSLELLAINSNNFSGVLPECISNFSSTLRILLVDNNNIVGKIPSGIVNLVNLERLEMWNNRLSGKIPPDIGKLQRLQVMFLDGNNLSGNIPHSLGNLSMLLLLDSSDNDLHGSIPSSLGNCQSLLVLDLSNNIFSGTIPPQVFDLSSLSIGLYLYINLFTGPLPIEVGNLKNLGEFDISENMLTGEIPRSLGSCIRLEFLSLQKNFFRGTIPSSFGSLRGLRELDLSRNNLSGKIQNFFVGLNSLQFLNLSYNNFEGLVPVDGVFKNSSATSVVGNNQLCGGIPEMHLPKCNFREPKKKKKSALTLKSTIFLVCGLLGVIFVLLFLFVCWLRKKIKEPTSSSFGNFLLNLSYQSLLKATEGFSSANLLGVGSFGSVYKGIIGEGRMTIAVKMLNLLRRGSSKSFLAECEALRNIRHRNLVKVLTVCSSVDYQGNDFKAVVYEFMVNGSLEDWLHPSANEDEAHQERRKLNIFQRLNIAIDVASALEYLHYHCETPILHCDLKPSNVLLDDEMIGHVGDFGLARFSPEANHNSSTNQSSSIGVRGTIGYTPPEYGMGNEVSSYGDIYSYGILLLEMFTGKRPTDDMFQGTLSLHSFVQEALPERVIEITDPILFQGRKEETTMNNAHNNNITRRSKIQECLILMFGIGVACSVEQPRERMSIKDVATKLLLIKKNLLETRRHGGGQITSRP